MGIERSWLRSSGDADMICNGGCHDHFERIEHVQVFGH